MDMLVEVLNQTLSSFSRLFSARMACQAASLSPPSQQAVSLGVQVARALVVPVVEGQRGQPGTSPGYHVVAVNDGPVLGTNIVDKGFQSGAAMLQNAVQQWIVVVVVEVEVESLEVTEVTQRGGIQLEVHVLKDKV